jgi:alpha-tubulin suppressor-like RCC1 family protein
MDMVVTLDAIPALGYYFNRFTHWDGACSGDGICTVIMDSDKTVDAEFDTTVAYPAIYAGKEHTVALKSDGTVWTWGDNTYGQLGVDPSTTPQSADPVQVPGLSNVKAVAAGGYHCFALLHNGDVYAWGDNTYGQLGDGTTDGSFSPVLTDSDVHGSTAIAAGAYHSLALRGDTVYAWGLNSSGQLGINSTTDSLLPVRVMRADDPTRDEMKHVTAIAAGSYHSLAVKDDGTVWTWGDNTYGQLGDATPSQRPFADVVTNLSGITGIAAGAAHSLAHEGGIVHAWGDNAYGQLGDNTGVSSSSPVQLTGIQDVTELKAGDYHSIALKDNGEVWVWGLNASGQLGDGTQDDSLLPIQVFGITDGGAVCGGGSHTIVLLNDGTLMTWGLNDKGQLGDGTTTSPQLLPIPGQIDLN